MATVNFLSYIPLADLQASGMTFDHALPQQWVDHVTDTLGERLTPEDNVASHFVYLYPQGDMMGGVMPVDRDGAFILQMYSEA